MTKSRNLLFFIAGIILTLLVIFSAITVYNIVVFKIPVIGQKISTPLPELNAVSRPVNFTEIPPYDPIRNQLITEDQAWENTWAFLHDRIGFSIYLPMEKRTAGLHLITDDKGNKYLAWEFFAMQKERPFLIFPRFTLGGEIFIDAHDGHVLWYAAFS